MAVGALAVLLVPLLQKREYAIALNKQMESAREQAEVADGLRILLERQQGDYNYVLAKKYSYPGAVQIIDDITRLLSDDTWVTQLEMRSTVRGKDAARELTLRGESANAGALISTLEESKLVEQAALDTTPHAARVIAAPKGTRRAPQDDLDAGRDLSDNSADSTVSRQEFDHARFPPSNAISAAASLSWSSSSIASSRCP